jgi:hypothetical protein
VPEPLLDALRRHRERLRLWVNSITLVFSCAHHLQASQKAALVTSENLPRRDFSIVSGRRSRSRLAQDETPFPR